MNYKFEIFWGNKPISQDLKNKKGKFHILCDISVLRIKPCIVKFMKFKSSMEVIAEVINQQRKMKSLSDFDVQ